MTAKWVPVTVPVEATVGSIHLRLFPYSSEGGPRPDDSFERPWAWGALCRVTFRFNGQRVTTKRITTRYSYADRLGWPRRERPSEASLAEGRGCVLRNLREMVTAHGVTPPADWPIESDEPAAERHDCERCGASDDVVAVTFASGEAADGGWFCWGCRL